MQPVTVENRADKNRFSGSAYITPLDIDFLGLNLSSGRNPFMGDLLRRLSCEFLASPAQ